MRRKINPQTSKLCAFCRYWNDPANCHIAPVKNSSLWEYDANVKSVCIKQKYEIISNASCPNFECKIKL